MGLLLCVRLPFPGLFPELAQHDGGIAGPADNGSLQEVQYFHCLRAIDPIDDPETVLPAVQDTALFEDCQVLGNIGLLHVQGWEYLTYATFTVAQVLHYAYSGGMTEGL